MVRLPKASGCLTRSDIFFPKCYSTDHPKLSENQGVISNNTHEDISGLTIALIITELLIKAAEHERTNIIS